MVGETAAESPFVDDEQYEGVVLAVAWGPWLFQFDIGTLVAR